MKHQLATIIVIATVIAFLCAATLYSLSPTTPRYDASPVKKLTIGNVVGYPDLAHIADAKGYFAENGLDVRFKKYRSPASLLGDLRSNETDLVSATAESLVARSGLYGNDLKILASVSRQDNYWEIIARRDKGIRTVADLKGKKIGINAGTAGEFLLGRFLTLHDVAISEVHLVNNTSDERTKHLQKGDIDAGVYISPYWESAKKSLGKEAVSWSIQSSRDTFSVSYTTTEYLSRNKSTVERYLRALLMAEEFVKSNDDEARSLMQERLDFSDENIANIWPHFNFELSLDQELLIAMEDEARWLVDRDKSDKYRSVPNYLDNIYFNGLESVKPESIRIIR